MSHDAQDDMVFEHSTAYDQDFWNSLLEDPPTPCQAPLHVTQEAESYATVNPYGGGMWTESEEDLLLNLWSQSGSGESKTNEFNSRSGATRSLGALKSKLSSLSGQGRDVPKRSGEPTFRSYTAEEKETLRECWNEVFLSVKEKAQRYNRLQRYRSEQALTYQYNRMVLNGEAPPIPDSKETNHVLNQIWANIKLGLDERTKQINEKLKAEHSTGFLAAKYGELVKIKRQWRLWDPPASQDAGDNEDMDGPWEPREVIRLIEIWPLPVKSMSFYNKVLNVMSLSGNDRSVQSMENKYRQLTGLVVHKHSDLEQVQVALDAESPFRYIEAGAEAWTRLEDNALRLICRVYSSHDWDSKTAEWTKLCNRERSSQDPQKLIDRWQKVLKVQKDCHPTDPTIWLRPAPMFTQG